MERMPKHVRKHSDNCFEVSFRRREEGKQDVSYYVGCFKTVAEAVKARDQAIHEYCRDRYES